MTVPTPLALSQSLVKLAEIVDAGEAETTRVRVLRADGSAVNGSLFGVEPTELTLVDDATHAFVQVPVADLQSVHVELPRRGREWLLAIGMIFVATAALVGYSMLPWVKPDSLNIGTGFAMFSVLFLGASQFLLARTGLRRWFTQWKQLYPPPGLSP